MTGKERKQLTLEQRVMAAKCLSLIILKAIQSEALVITFIWHTSKLCNVLTANYSGPTIAKRFNLNRKPFIDCVRAETLYKDIISLICGWNKERLKKSNAGVCGRQFFVVTVGSTKMTFSFNILPVLDGQALVLTRVS